MKLCIFLYLGLVAWLYPTLGVQMFEACCFHRCLHFFLVSVRIRYISPVKILVWTFADRALSCVAHGRGCHLSPVQDKYVIKRSAQPDTIVSKTKVDILGTQVVKVGNDVIHGTMVQVKPPIPNQILVGNSAGRRLENWQQR